MKFTILLEILFDLLAKRRLTAAYLAEKHGISVRTVYRYIDHMSLTVPVFVKRGRNGGICISDSYKLPVGFMTKEEYESAIEALETMYSQLPQERFLTAKHKLSAQVKAETRDRALSGEVGTILVDGGTWGDTKAFSDKLRLFEESVKERTVLEIEYRSRSGERTGRRIEPHVLVCKQAVWYVYAFCHKQRAFRLFRLGRVFSAVKTEERFQKRPFTREDIPLSFWTNETESVDARLAVSEAAFADAQDWLGDEHLRLHGDTWYADITLPDDDMLVKKILSLGAGVTVLSPASLRKKVARAAAQIANAYQK
ncbi:MAG: YafY family transcriptional regulator [Clostridia bacterium]|nr:YafY family transcriptional regulator [Clostridia bacterium]